MQQCCFGLELAQKYAKDEKQTVWKPFYAPENSLRKDFLIK